MIKKGFLYVILIALAIYVLFVLIAPPLVEKSKNKVSTPPPYIVSKKAQKLFDQLDFVADLHCDALLWNRKLHKKHEYGHVDFPRMQEGNVAFQAFTIVTKSPKGQNFSKNSAEAFDMITPLCIGQGQSISTWFSLVARSVYQCKKLHRFASKFNDEFIVVKSKKDFESLLAERTKNKNVIGGLLGVEGAHCLEGKLSNFDKIYDAGVRMLGPAHFFDNEFGGSAHGEKQDGLSEFGFKILKEMEKKSMIMDLAHSSNAVINDVIANYNGPILSSHTGVKGIYNSGRNLSDQQLKAIARKEGLVGIAYFEGALGNLKISTIVQSMKYVKNLIGIEHVALGSDFDGSVTTPFDCTGLAFLVEEMLKQNFSQEEIKAIMGENVKRFLLSNLR